MHKDLCQSAHVVSLGHIVNDEVAGSRGPTHTKGCVQRAADGQAQALDSVAACLKVLQHKLSCSFLTAHGAAQACSSRKVVITCTFALRLLAWCTQQACKQRAAASVPPQGTCWSRHQCVQGRCSWQQAQASCCLPQQAQPATTGAWVYLLRVRLTWMHVMDAFES